MALVLAVCCFRGDAKFLHASPSRNAYGAMRTSALELLPRGVLRLRGGAFEIPEERLEMLTEDPPEGETLTEKQLRRSVTFLL